MNNIPFISLADKSSSKILFSLPDNSVKRLYRKYYSIKFNLIQCTIIKQLCLKVFITIILYRDFNKHLK